MTHSCVIILLLGTHRYGDHYLTRKKYAAHAKAIAACIRADAIWSPPFVLPKTKIVSVNALLPKSKPPIREACLISCVFLD